MFSIDKIDVTPRDLYDFPKDRILSQSTDMQRSGSAVEKLSEQEKEADIVPLPIRTTSTKSSVSAPQLIRMMRDHGPASIAELEERIAQLDQQRLKLVRERETIQQLLNIAQEHDSSQ